MTATASRSSELKIIAQHTGSVLAGQLAVMAFGIADTVIAGRYSDTALAALSVGSALYISVYVGLIGIVQALLPIWSEMLGAGQRHAVGASVRQSLYLGLIITVAGMAALAFPAPLLAWAEVPTTLLAEVSGYLTVLAFAFAPALLFRIYGAFNQSLGKPLMVTSLQVLALAVKIPLSIWLVAGGAGIEPMGAVGCAWATLIVNYFLLALAVLLLRTQQIYAPFALWQRMERPDWREIKSFFSLGLPGGMAYLVEVTSFTLIALFVARLGTVASASHQIAASIAAALYMMPLSLGIAASARVSFWLGAGDAEKARALVFLTLRLAVLTSIAMSALIFIARDVLAGAYSTTPAVVLQASSLLIRVALYHVADSLQAVSAFLLRCYRVTLAPLAIYGVLLWGLGLWGGYQLTYKGWDGLLATGATRTFWQTSTVAIALVALSLALLLVRLVYRNEPGGPVKPTL